MIFKMKCGISITTVWEALEMGTPLVLTEAEENNFLVNDHFYPQEKYICYKLKLFVLQLYYYC